MSSNYEEWMKMATDNKINAQNSWNFALIDYFHDMSLLRNNDDNSINFQRASCTLDGCVKIWTSRVDSVGTDTGKLLSNLETGGTNVDDEGHDSDNPDGDQSQPKKRKERGQNSTLVKDPSQLKNKKPDLEFAVDPLFRKTCADFDEGGAGGLLMNHLSLGVGSEGCMRVVFDASDPMGKVEEEEVVEEPEDDVDLSFLRKHFLPDLGILEEKAISHSLEGFSFAKDAFTFDDTTFFADNTRNFGCDDDDADGNGGMNMDPGDTAPVEDFFGGDDFGGDNDNQSNNGGFEPAAEGEPSRTGPFVPFDPRQIPTERDFVLAMADGDGGTLDYFDQNFHKNWAGPEHWKLRKVIRRPAETDAGATKSNKRQKKEATKIDFMSPPEKSIKELTKELFAEPAKPGSINLAGTGTTTGKKGKKKKEKVDDHRLPDDMHFSSRQLVTLFLKPKFFLKMRGRRAKINENGDGEVDENFWAQAAADQAANRDNDGDDSKPPSNLPT
ncbi:hypothetical protein NLJ89_g11890 [Agrocybe chaxingu]|uniref:Condensin complex subunit 2 n=1 Tax=Agrocybe chaxingu TaxID=84603 RepID=A0A9W8MQS0_9AGAR|nr:hypothetical protein NLJ89_g11890 [Agrocybe chaxingu]